MSFELKLTIKSQAELNELVDAIETHNIIQEDTSVEIIDDNGSVNRDDFNNTIDRLLTISRLRERLECVTHLASRLPKK